MATRPTLPSPFVPRAVLKRDVFSEIAVGSLRDEPERTVTYRRVAHSAPWSRPLAWALAKREIRALAALQGLENTPELLGVDASGLYRSWIEGAPLHVAKPFGNAAYFRDAKRLLHALHRRGVAHNDLAKPQNWLMTPDGRAALIDMQLATVFKKRTALFRLLAREDLRHLLKQKRTWCRAALTPSEKRLLASRSLPAQIWMKTFKPVYNGVTRGIFRWSDGEGTRDRMDSEGQAIAARLDADPAVAGHAVLPFPYPKSRGGIGIYAFVEAMPGVVPADLEARLRKAPSPRPDIVQVVRQLPRDAAGTVREDLLRLVAINHVEEIDGLAGEAATRDLMREIAAGRGNLTDRRLKL
ncbi:serine/threonine protein kinase [Aureimonas endophytica]|uniref:Serine/threonine protein kinase n=1 Tax=Aureimonas endophytica TaxID=2027858 RepID=A0A916ZFE8_9HYPH|nr:serine/threonine protein kinase [Aureimonas endophytica]GGD92076.1 serine/threonine protein kinase [Aureimonas endophytica]